MHHGVGAGAHGFFRQKYLIHIIVDRRQDSQRRSSAARHAVNKDGQHGVDHHIDGDGRHVQEKIQSGQGQQLAHNGGAEGGHPVKAEELQRHQGQPDGDTAQSGIPGGSAGGPGQQGNDQIGAKAEGHSRRQIGQEMGFPPHRQGRHGVDAAGVVHPAVEGHGYGGGIDQVGNGTVVDSAVENGVLHHHQIIGGVSRLEQYGQGQRHHPNDKIDNPEGGKACQSRPVNGGAKERWI